MAVIQINICIHALYLCEPLMVILLIAAQLWRCFLY